MKPGCKCWYWNHAEGFEPYDEWRTVEVIVGIDASYTDQWSQDWKFCPYCGSAAEKE